MKILLEMCTYWAEKHFPCSGKLLLITALQEKTIPFSMRVFFLVQFGKMDMTFTCIWKHFIFNGNFFVPLHRQRDENVYNTLHTFFFSFFFLFHFNLIESAKMNYIIYSQKKNEVHYIWITATCLLLSSHCVEKSHRADVYTA